MPFVRPVISPSLADTSFELTGNDTRFAGQLAHSYVRFDKILASIVSRAREGMDSKDARRKTIGFGKYILY